MQGQDAKWGKNSTCHGRLSPPQLPVPCEPSAVLQAPPAARQKKQSPQAWVLLRQSTPLPAMNQSVHGISSRSTCGR
jgi:hypothetical protein